MPGTFSQIPVTRRCWKDYLNRYKVCSEPGEHVRRLRAGSHAVGDKGSREELENINATERTTTKCLKLRGRCMRQQRQEIQTSVYHNTEREDTTRRAG